eukprot:c21730_g1_i1 orf=91-1458(+)
MADPGGFSIEGGAASSGLSAKRTWSTVEYALGLLGFMAISSAMVMVVDYKRIQGSISLWVSLEQPDFFRPSADETLFVHRTIVEGAVAKGAVCLDGSPPAYHLDRGKGLGVNNWLIHLEGGGWCSTSKTCLLRSGTRLGSSHFMEEQVVFGGSLSDSPSKNPDFYNWNRVKVRYCDGGSFSGDIDAPLEFELDKVNQSKKVYFRGQRVWQAVVHDLLSKGLKNAEKALLSGCSAGGLASIIHCDNFRSQLPEKATVKCLSDAGFFLDERDVMNRSTIQSFYKDVVSLHGIAAQLPQSCKEADKCFFPQYLTKAIKTPLFILNPAYDTWQIQNILLPIPADHLAKWKFCVDDPAECSNEQLKVLQGFRVKLLEALDAVETSESGGFFINSCFIHCQSELDMTWHRAKTPTVNHRTISETVGDWFYERSRAKEIDCAYPCNPSCFKIGVWGSPPARR